MAHSKNRTTLAVLRSHLGPLGGEHELASIIGRSASWVNKVSAGRIYMTRDAAIRISMETGVCPEWLLHNDPSTSPVAAESGVRFDSTFFNKYRENLVSTKPTMVDPLIQISSEALPAFVLCVARHFQAVRASPGEVRRLSEWLKNAAHILENEFPFAEGRNSAELDRAALELCRLTARAWAPRRKGYKRATGKAKSSASMEGTELRIESAPEQSAHVEHRRLRV
jgi:plasmid maintenance system antidote protein VapI